MELPGWKWQTFFIAFMLLFLFLGPNTAKASGHQPPPALNDVYASQSQKININTLNAYLTELHQEYQGYFPQTPQLTNKMVKNAAMPSANKWINGLVRYFFQECYHNIHTLGIVILLTIFSMILQSIQSAFEKQTVSKVAYALIYMVLLTVALKSFKELTVYVLDSVTHMSQFLLALTPMILSLTAVAGSLSTALMFHPMILLLINTVEWVIAKGIVPLLILSTLLGVISTLTEHYKASRLADMMRQTAVLSLVVFFAVFLGVMSIRGAVASVSDGVLSKTVKFMTGNFVPVIGRMFSDATETVLSASALLRNTVGLVGLVILAGIIIFPAIKIMVVTIMYRFSSAILQPLGDGPVIKSLDIISKSMLAIFAAYLIVSLMFFLSVCIIIASGNLTLMVR